MASLQVARLHAVGDVTVVEVLVDRLDYTNLEVFCDSLAPIQRGAKVALDLSRVKFVNSAALGTFISLNTRLRASGGVLKFCGVSANIREILNTTKLDKLFSVASTRDVALQELAR